MTENTASDKAPFSSPDWTRLASDALDLWQNHLTSLAEDPKAKEEMTRLIAPMTQMCAGWMDLMQQGLQGMNAYPTAQQSYAEPNADTASAPSATDGRSYGEPVRDSASSGADAVTARWVDLNMDDKPMAWHPHNDQPLASVEWPVIEPVMEHKREAIVTPAIDTAPVDVATELQQSLARVAERFAASTDIPESLLRESGRADVEQPIVSAVVAPEPAPTRGSAAPADGPRDLAQLAVRLAELERELEGLRASRRSNEDAADTDASADRAVQRLA